MGATTARPIPLPIRPLEPIAAASAPARAAEQPRERSVTRFTARDYTYVRREFQRIAILAAAIIITLIVLSFFLP